MKKKNFQCLCPATETDLTGLGCGMGIRILESHHVILIGSQVQSTGLGTVEWNVPGPRDGARKPRG